MKLESVDFEALVDNEVHYLSGVDEGYVEAHRFGRREARSALTFILDGVTYRGVESEEDDDYRSSMGPFGQVEAGVRNTFPPQPVRVRMRPSDRGYGEDDVLEILDARTHALVLELGTADINDYYPSFVCGFYPQAMSANEGVGE